MVVVCELYRKNRSILRTFIEEWIGYQLRKKNLHEKGQRISKLQRTLTRFVFHVFKQPVSVLQNRIFRSKKSMCQKMSEDYLRSFDIFILSHSVLFIYHSFSNAGI